MNSPRTPTTTVDATGHGCAMCSSLYIRANGEMPCWDDVGEEHLLRALQPARLQAGLERDLFVFPELLHIRRSFLGGQLPFPSLCPQCALLGHGSASSERPRIVEVLHVEPSFLCSLACPECIPPERRRSVRRPPYTMSPAFLEAVLRQLRTEGVEEIRFVHFEGRGDPLMNPRLGEMVEVTLQAFPGSFTTVTSHGSYPFRPWLLRCGLHVLRLSVDGATETSYRRYRRGGELARVIDLMRSIRDERRRDGSQLRVEWKYTLFAWNDSDEEILEAGRLAAELEVDLRFCLTHSRLRSKRIQTHQELHQTIERLAPQATCASTFQSRPAGGRFDGRVVVAEHVDALLRSALARLEVGARPALTHLRGVAECAARAKVAEALRLDPGLNAAGDEDPLESHLERIVRDARSPATLSGLANLAMVWRKCSAAERLFRRYLELAPSARDRETVELRISELRVASHLETAIQHVRRGDIQAVRDEVVQALRIDPGVETDEGEDPLTAHLDSVLAGAVFPSTLSGLANIALLCDHWLAAEKLFRRYLEVAPSATDRSKVELTLLPLAVGNRLGCALRDAPGVGPARISAAEIEVLRLDPGLRGAHPASWGECDDPVRTHLGQILNDARYPLTLGTLAYLRLLRGDRRLAMPLLQSYEHQVPDPTRRHSSLEQLLPLWQRAGLVGRLRSWLDRSPFHARQ